MMFYPLIILIPLMPLLAGIIIYVSRVRSEKICGIGTCSQMLAFVLSLLALYEVSIREPIQTASFGIGVFQFGLYVDKLAAVMMVLISGISALIHLFSKRYMQEERGFTWFYTLLAITTSALLFMVASPNLLMLFIFWQLLSGLLALLSYNYSHAKTVQGALKTYTILRIGDAAFLAGIILAYYIYGTLDLPKLFIVAAEAPVVFSLLGIVQINAVTAVTLLIFIGAMSKSAQFPLHIWLPDALYAPTPVHALLHAGIINAGGFLLNRLAPLYGQSATTLHVVFVIGLITALLGSSMMLIQNDIKKTLGYSTIGQMGYMIMECGLGAFALAIFHLIAHGLFKATVFLNCGNVIHLVRQEPRLPEKNDTPFEGMKFSLLTWLTGLVTTLILPLVILLAAHGALSIPLAGAQGILVFLFFGWVTSSQAILSLYRLQAVSSWKVAATMLLTLFLIVLTYLWAGERFSHFLYPVPGDVNDYFRAAAFPSLLFDSLVAVTALFILIGWIVIYAKSHRQTIRMPNWINAGQVRLYVLLVNRLYLDILYRKMSQGIFFSYRAGLMTASLILPFGLRMTGFSLLEIAIFLSVFLMLPFLESLPWRK